MTKAVLSSHELSQKADEAWFKVIGLKNQNLADLIPKELHHYTPTATAIEGIVKTKKLFLSPHDDVNDPSEILHGLEIAADLLENNPPNNLPTATICSMIDGMRNLDPSLKKFRYYFACFSSVKDDVSQWRSYGAEGSGYCVSFKTDNLMRIDGKLQNLTKPLFDVIQVIYDDAIKGQLINEFIKEFSYVLINGGQNAVATTLRYLMMLSTFFKHSAYAAEKEWRLILLTYDDENPNNTDIESRLIGTHLREKMLVDVPGHNAPMDAICQITCGPKQNDANVRALRRFLKGCNNMAHVNVAKSCVPMR